VNQKYARFLSAAFCGVLALGAAANALTPDAAFSEVENRTLAQRPALTGQDLLSGKFMSDYETYTTDQFVARDMWVAGKAWLERLTGKQENNGVYFCDGSTLISRFDAPDETRLARNLNSVNAFAESAQVPVVFGLIPTQATVWADKLPDGAPNQDQKPIIDRAAQQAGAAGSADLYTTLMAHRDEPIYYRTDHHWTSLGAYYGYEALGAALGYTPLPLSSYAKTTVSREFYGTVFSSSGVRWVEPDEMDVYVPAQGITVVSYTMDSSAQLVEEPRKLYDESFLTKKDKYSMFLGGQQALCKITTGQTDKPKLLIVRDSYTDCLVPFLTAHFSEIHLYDLRYFRSPVSEYVREQGIDQVLVLYSVPNFVSDTNLSLLR